MSTLMEKLDHMTGTKGAEVLNAAEGIVEAFVAGIGNKDSVADIVEKGAFDKSLRERTPRVVWGHDWNHPIGKVLDIREVPAGDESLPDKMKVANIGGLFARVQFNLLSEKGREAFNTVAFFGEEQEWSIGYKTILQDYDPMAKANRLKEVELFEVSPVLHGANNLTGTVSIKSEDYTSDTLTTTAGGLSTGTTNTSNGSFTVTNNSLTVTKDISADDMLTKDLIEGYADEAEAASRGAQIGCSGTHNANGKFFPCESPEALVEARRTAVSKAIDDDLEEKQGSLPGMSDDDLRRLVSAIEVIKDFGKAVVKLRGDEPTPEPVTPEAPTGDPQAAAQGAAPVEKVLEFEISEDSDMNAISADLEGLRVKVNGFKITLDPGIDEDSMKKRIASVLQKHGITSLESRRVELTAVSQEEL